MTTGETQRRVHIGKGVRDALVFRFGGSPRAPVGDSAILGAVGRLFTLLAERRIGFLLAGEIALLQYVEARNTSTTQLILSPDSLAKLPEIEVLGQEEGTVRGTFEGLQIDLLLTRNPFFELVQRRYGTTRPFVESEIPCATVEGIVLLKLYALPSLYRQRNLVRAALYETDVFTLIHLYQPEIEPLFQELAPHLSATDLAALRKIMAEIQGRISRFGEGF